MKVRSLVAPAAALALVVTSAGVAVATSAPDSTPTPSRPASVSTRAAQLRAMSFVDGDIRSTRLAGTDRYQTSVEVSRNAWDPEYALVVNVVSGESFPDALSVGASSFGPVLLTRHDVLPASVADEIKRLQPCAVVVVGGETAVSKQVEAQADSYVDRKSDKCTMLTAP